MQRQSNIELLRIVAMSFILILHFLTHSIQILDMNSYVYQSLVIVNICGVNLFVMISGYLGIKGSIHSFIKLYGIIVFFSILCFFAGAVLFDMQISMSRLIRILLFPFSFQYWFLRCYLGLFALAPLINKGLSLLSTYELRRLIVALTVISVYSCWVGRNMIGMDGYSLFHFIYLYVLGFFFSHDKASDVAVSRWVFLGVASMSLNIALAYITDSYYDDFENIYWKVAIAYNNPFVILSSISIFMCFAKLKIRSIAWINSLASASLGCYLLQEGIIKTEVYEMQRGFALTHTLLETLLMYGVTFFIYWMLSISLSRIYLSSIYKMIRRCLESRIIATRQ